MRGAGVLAVLAISLAASYAPQVFPLPVKIVYNPSDSVPHGWYRVEAVANTTSLQAGNIVLAQLTADAAALAAHRRHLPTGIPILKRIGAVDPQSVLY